MHCVFNKNVFLCPVVPWGTEGGERRCSLPIASVLRASCEYKEGTLCMPRRSFHYWVTYYILFNWHCKQGQGPSFAEGGELEGIIVRLLQYIIWPRCGKYIPAKVKSHILKCQICEILKSQFRQRPRRQSISPYLHMSSVNLWKRGREKSDELLVCLVQWSPTTPVLHQRRMHFDSKVQERKWNALKQRILGLWNNEDLHSKHSLPQWINPASEGFLKLSFYHNTKQSAVLDLRKISSVPSSAWPDNSEAMH